METNVMPSIVQMNEEILKTLLTEVKETVATDVVFTETKKSTFGVVNMWNIRKGAKSASSLLRR
jgi:hypothetical protein